MLWQRSIGRLNASSPTYYKHRLYIVNLVPGHIVKLDATTGQRSGNAGCRDGPKSSPLVVGDTLYFGCETTSSSLLARPATGTCAGRRRLGGPVRAATAYYHGILYVGDYGGHMNAVNAKTGKLRWQSGSLGRDSGPRASSTRLPPSPSAASTRATTITASTASTSATGRSPGPTRPAATSTRPDRCADPAQPADRLRRLPRRQRLALDAKDGETLSWSYSAGGEVIGSLSAIGDTVYVAESTDDPRPTVRH